MSWIQLSLTADAERAPLIAAVLENLGALSVTHRDAGDAPVLEPVPGETRLWQRTRVTGLFAGDREPEELHTRVGQVLGQETGRTLTLERLADRAWERVWLDAFQPMQFGRRLWVRPAGKPVAAEDAVILELDPGLAFGTGNHPTTALCLRWLDAATLDGRSLIDYGCGSGILAIAALKLGAASVVAVDHDPQALTATVENARKNGADGQQLLMCSPDQVPSVPVDIVLANILAGTLVELRPKLQSLVKPGGWVVLSGIMEDQAEQVIEAYRPLFAMGPKRVQAGWVLLAGRRQDTKP